MQQKLILKLLFLVGTNWLTTNDETWWIAVLRVILSLPLTNGLEKGLSFCQSRRAAARGELCLMVGRYNVNSGTHEPVVNCSDMMNYVKEQSTGKSCLYRG